MRVHRAVTETAISRGSAIPGAIRMGVHGSVTDTAISRSGAIPGAIRMGVHGAVTDSAISRGGAIPGAIRLSVHVVAILVISEAGGGAVSRVEAVNCCEGASAERESCG